MDELSVTGPSTLVEVRQGETGAPFELTPEECGLGRHGLASLLGGDPADNAALTRAILQGGRGAPRDAVLLNAAATLYVAGVSPTIRLGVERAADSLDSGRAAAVLERLVAISDEVGGRA
jgi:anthranilate phosphoribosyltransferase